MIVYKKARQISDDVFKSAYINTPGLVVLYTVGETVAAPGLSRIFAFHSQEDAEDWEYGDSILKCDAQDVLLPDNLLFNAVIAWDRVMEWWKNPTIATSAYAGSVPKGTVLCRSLRIDEVVA